MVTESTPNWEKTAFILNGLVTKTLDIAIDGSMMLILPSMYRVLMGGYPILISGIWVFFVKNPGVPPGKREFKWENTILNLVFRPKMKGGPGTPPQMGGLGVVLVNFIDFLTKNTEITILAPISVFFDKK